MVTIDRETCIGCGKCVWACPTAFLIAGDPTPVANPARHCMMCMHCVAACPQKAVFFEELERDATYPQMPEGELERTVKLRRSVRKYRPETPDKATVEWALDAARWAPSTKNTQLTRWSVIWGAEKVDHFMTLLCECAKTGNTLAVELTEMLKANNRNSVTCDAPGVLIGYCRDGAYNGKIDCAIATTTLDLLLASRGVATCWGGHLASMLQKCPEIKAYAGIPDGFTAYTALLIGNTDGEVYPNVAYRRSAEVQWFE